MLRDIIVNGNIAVDATYKADEAMGTGYAVVKGDGVAEFPSAETAAELFFVQKDREPVGAYAGLTNFSDYNDMFNTVAAGETIVLCSYPSGSEFATSAYDATTAVAGNINKVFSATTGGLMKKATASTVLSKYLFLGTITDNGHTLAKFRVLDTAIAN